MMVQPRLIRLGLKCVVSSTRVGFPHVMQSSKDAAKLRKIAFHIDALRSVKEEASSFSPSPTQVDYFSWCLKP